MFDTAYQTWICKICQHDVARQQIQHQIPAMENQLPVSVGRIWLDEVKYPPYLGQPISCNWNAANDASEAG
jgi:hypothetical protein